ncbi:uncharacterized protein LOC129737636 [Uranotaenia lowii]|uniref:uncharacterized protein LOC129737636 n=1 Tax=Uranotaenia lowii TaxID=190385 RepID=UPI002479F284|nr:uncharacterized protein LOC129737636 [Uranotaenia lowii]
MRGPGEVESEGREKDTHNDEIWEWHIRHFGISRQGSGASKNIIATNLEAHVVTAKSKVAPLEDLARKKKKQSIPRLELSSALLLSHLYDKLRKSIPFTISAYFWTDSMIVQYWLASLPSRWQSFVGNRVSEIHHITKSGI